MTRYFLRRIVVESLIHNSVDFNEFIVTTVLVNRRRISGMLIYAGILYNNILFFHLVLRLEDTIHRRKRLSLRGRMDIMASILSETKRVSRKTRIMYSCNLSFRQLKVYLKLLVDKGFLKVIPIRESETVADAFQITKKGRTFLKAYDNLREKFPRS